MKKKPQAEGSDLLRQLSRGMAVAQKEFFGKGPEDVKSYIVDDLLFIVMRGGLTTAEKTMMDFDKPDQVREFRQTFENEMTERLIGMVEDLSGRKVLTYQSQILFEPDLVVEIFVFDRIADEEARIATGHGQIVGDGTGEAPDEVLENPSESGQ